MPLFGQRCKSVLNFIQCTDKQRLSDGITSLVAKWECIFSFSQSDFLWREFRKDTKAIL